MIFTVSVYSIWFGLANILCVLVLPLPGISITLLDKFFTKGNGCFRVLSEVTNIKSYNHCHSFCVNEQTRVASNSRNGLHER